MLVRSYMESGADPIPPLRLPDDEYGRGLQCFVPACADIVIIDRGRQEIYLARRQSKPMVGWWWIGGKMLPHETKEAAAVRNFRRETGLEISYDRLDLAGVLDYVWKDRSQPPQEMGCHMVAFTFVIELSPEELNIVSSNLDQSEYEQSEGLSAFDRTRLIDEDVFPAILDLYDQIFPV